MPVGQDNKGYQVENEIQDIPPGMFEQEKISLIFFFAVRKFTGDQELEAMGFEMYSGSEINRLVVHIRQFCSNFELFRPQSQLKKPNLERVISVQSDFFQGGEENFYDRQGPGNRYGH